MARITKHVRLSAGSSVLNWTFLDSADYAIMVDVFEEVYVVDVSTLVFEQLQNELFAQEKPLHRATSGWLNKWNSPTHVIQVKEIQPVEYS